MIKSSNTVLNGFIWVMCYGWKISSLSLTLYLQSRCYLNKLIPCQYYKKYEIITSPGFNVNITFNQAKLIKIKILDTQETTPLGKVKEELL